MDIKDIKAKQGKIEVVGEIASLSPSREVRTASGPGKVANAVLKDNTGEVKLSLWNEQVDQVSAGDKVKITNGYANEFRGEIQLSTGKFGTLEVLEKQKGLFGAINEKKEAAATQDNLEEAEALAGESEPSVDEALTDDNLEEAELTSTDEPDIDEYLTADNVVESEDIVDKKIEPVAPPKEIVEEDIEISEEEVF